jgi:hypothetical protein
MPQMHHLGSLTPVVWFRDSTGHVIVAPYSTFPTPNGYIREEADTLPKIDRLTSMLMAQERIKLQAEHLHEDEITARARQQVKERLEARLISSETSEYERDFIRHYLLLREERRAKFHPKWDEFVIYNHAREHSLGNRRADEEKAP